MDLAVESDRTARVIRSYVERIATAPSFEELGALLHELASYAESVRNIIERADRAV